MRLRGRYLYVFPPSRILRRGVGLSYAEKGGGSVRKGETGWWKVNGVWINTRAGQVRLLFRRAA